MLLSMRRRFVFDDDVENERFRETSGVDAEDSFCELLVERDVRDCECDFVVFCLAAGSVLDV